MYFLIINYSFNVCGETLCMHRNKTHAIIKKIKWGSFLLHVTVFLGLYNVYQRMNNKNTVVAVVNVTTSKMVS